MPEVVADAPAARAADAPADPASAAAIEHRLHQSGDADNYDADQLAYIHCTSTNNVVIGNPGSGKTTALAARLRHMTRARGYPVTSQLVLTFFKATHLLLFERLSPIFGTDTPRCVRTVHSVCYALTDGADVATAVVRALRLGADAFAREFADVTHVYVDEAQVLNESMVELLVRIRSACAWISVDLLGDPAQNCWTRVASPAAEVMLSWHGRRTYELTRNYRSATDIVRLCNALHPFANDAPTERCARGLDHRGVGLRPMQSVRTEQGRVVLFVGSREAQLAHLDEALDRIPLTHTIGVLCANIHGHARMRSHICCQDVANHLYEARVPFCAWYNATRSSSDVVGVERKRARLVVSTIHATLGHEFDHVFAFAYHHKTDKRRPTRDEHYHHRKMHHIARSRAKRTLTLLAGHDMKLFLTPEAALRQMHVLAASSTLDLPDPARRGTFSDAGRSSRPMAAGGAAAQSRSDAVVCWGSLHCLDPTVLMRLQDLFDTRFCAGRLWPSPLPLGTTETEAAGGTPTSASAAAADSAVAAAAARAPLPEYEQLSTLYGMFAENVVCVAASSRSPLKQALLDFTDPTRHTLCIDVRTAEAQFILQALDWSDGRARTTLSRRHLRALYAKCCKAVFDEERKGARTRSAQRDWPCRRARDLLEHALRASGGLDDARDAAAPADAAADAAADDLTLVNIVFQSENRWCDVQVLRAWAAAEPTTLNLWNVCLFWWQYENDAAWRMMRDYSAHIAALRPLIDRWRALGARLADTASALETQVPCALLHSKYPDHRIVGSADLVVTPSQEHQGRRQRPRLLPAPAGGREAPADARVATSPAPTVYEWKFSTRELTTNHRLQAAGYAHSLSYCTNVRHDVVVANLLSGELQRVCYARFSLDELFEACFPPAAAEKAAAA